MNDNYDDVIVINKVPSGGNWNKDEVIEIHSCIVCGKEIDVVPGTNGSLFLSGWRELDSRRNVLDAPERGVGGLCVLRLYEGTH